MTRVFVSYSRKDQEFVLRLVNDLRKQGVPLWLDQQDIKPGERWDRAIERALDNATHLLLILSKHSTDSDNVRDEVDIAIDDKKLVVPVIIDDCKPPLRVRRMQFTDFRTDYSDALNRLLTVLPKADAALPSAPPAPKAAPQKKTPNAVSTQDGARIKLLAEFSVPYMLNSLAWSLDSRLLAVGGSDGTILLMDVASGEHVAEWSAHEDIIYTMAFNAAGQLASGSKDGSLALWQIPTPALLWRSTTNSTVRCLAFDGAGQAASGHHDGLIRRWDPVTGQLAGKFNAHSDAVMGLAFNRDSLLASCGDDRMVKLWTTAPTKEPQLHQSIPVSNYVLSVAFSPDGRLLAWGEFDSAVGLYDIQTDRQTVLPQHSKAVRSVAFSPVGTLLASGSEDKTICLWNVDKRSRITALEGHTEPIRGVAFSPDGKFLASAGFDAIIRLWGALQ